MAVHVELNPSHADPTPLNTPNLEQTERVGGGNSRCLHAHACACEYCTYSHQCFVVFFANEIMKQNVPDEGRTGTNSQTESIFL